MFRFLILGLSLGVLLAQRPTPPTRDPHTAGYPPAKDLPDGEIPSPTADGNFVLGPTHKPAPEMAVQPGVPHGTVFDFTMESKDSKIYPGIAREPDTFGKPDPDDPAKLIVTTSHPAPYTRRVAVYVPKQYVPGTAAPFIVGADGPDRALFTALDNLIAEHKVPVHDRDFHRQRLRATRRAASAAWNTTPCPACMRSSWRRKCCRWWRSNANVKLTKDPEGRATMGGSSGGSCALIMAWYHPELYHRVLTYSGTYVNQQWPWNPETPHGAWEFHEHADSEQPGEADPPLDGGGRPGQLQSQHHARQHARLGGGQ